MPFSTGSVAMVCAVQKIVPAVPMRKLSRTLSDVPAEAGAVSPMVEAAAVTASAVLRISSLRSVRWAADHHVAAARHRLIHGLVEIDWRRVDQAQRRID